MTGVENLVVERRGSIQFSGTAHTAALPDEAQWHEDNPFNPFTPGLLNIPIVTVTNTGLITITTVPFGFVLQFAELTIKKGN